MQVDTAFHPTPKCAENYRADGGELWFSRCEGMAHFGRMMEASACRAGASLKVPAIRSILRWLSFRGAEVVFAQCGDTIVRVKLIRPVCLDSVLAAQRYNGSHAAIQGDRSFTGRRLPLSRKAPLAARYHAPVLIREGTFC